MVRGHRPGRSRRLDSPSRTARSRRSADRSFSAPAAVLALEPAAACTGVVPPLFDNPVWRKDGSPVWATLEGHDSDRTSCCLLQKPGAERTLWKDCQSVERLTDVLHEVGADRRERDVGLPHDRVLVRSNGYCPTTEDHPARVVAGCLDDAGPRRDGRCGAEVVMDSITKLPVSPTRPPRQHCR